MKTETFKGTIESAYGQTVSPALKFEGTYEAYESITELRASKDFPADKEIVAFVNSQNKANARQKLMQETLTAAGYSKPTLENDQQLQLRTLVKVFVASGKSESEAQAIAESTLGVKMAA